MQADPGMTEIMALADEDIKYYYKYASYVQKDRRRHQRLK